MSAKERVTVVRLTRTCEACPSQWEGLLSDGRHLYARFRWGHGTIAAGVTLEEAVHVSMGWEDGDVLAGWESDCEMDGYCDTATMLGHLASQAGVTAALGTDP